MRVLGAVRVLGPIKMGSRCPPYRLIIGPMQIAGIMGGVRVGRPVGGIRLAVVFRTASVAVLTRAKGVARDTHTTAESFSVVGIPGWAAARVLSSEPDRHGVASLLRRVSAK